MKLIRGCFGAKVRFLFIYMNLVSYSVFKFEFVSRFILIYNYTATLV